MHTISERKYHSHFGYSHPSLFTFYLHFLRLTELFLCFQYWNVLALDGSNWQRIDLFDFQRDIEVQCTRQPGEWK